MGVDPAGSIIGTFGVIIARGGGISRCIIKGGMRGFYRGTIINEVQFIFTGSMQYGSHL
jgi:hypothetical protein